MGIFDKAKDAVQGHEGQVDQGIEKAGDAVDARTGGQHAEHVDKAQDMAGDRLGIPDQADAGGGDPADENNPPASNI